MDDKCIVRKAEVADKPAWSTMRNQLWPDTIPHHCLDIDSYFDFSSEDIVEVLVIEYQGELIGFIELNIRSHADGIKGRGVPFVEGWYVDEAFRNRGLGKLLLHYAESWAVRLGYQWIASEAAIDNQQAIACHRAAGFEETERQVSFVKFLRD